MHPYIAVPATLALVYRAYSRNSLTPTGIVIAALTAVVHAIHPWSVFFTLLTVFFLAGTFVTKIKHDIKARLTLSSAGASGGEGPRTSIQVLANSAMASVLILLHYWQIHYRSGNSECFAYGGDLLVAGIIGNYAAVAADTFSSELGILSSSKPRLLVSPTFRQVPPGTNGGVTMTGIVAGLGGAFIIALTSVLLVPFCGTNQRIGNSILSKRQVAGLESSGPWTIKERVIFVLAVTVWGGIGSLLDSALGGWFQQSVIDSRSGKVVEGIGGKKVLVRSTKTNKKNNGDAASRRIESGWDLLDNNGINVLMAFIMSVGGMVAVGYAWDVPLSSIFA